ncbi:hypothetical protein QAD02_011412 [Eretmocerus hayati]|uniref:Uncharacterized protein n=1 Tax=Eretmocerus hayati TaxID=131215 RepID=A0ACC2NYE5_9HYME|nr:hypothetical protein QAD02_011412 [Eretmocerus hayati]
MPKILSNRNSNVATLMESLMKRMSKNPALDRCKRLFVTGLREVSNSKDHIYRSENYPLYATEYATLIRELNVDTELFQTQGQNFHETISELLDKYNAVDVYTDKSPDSVSVGSACISHKSWGSSRGTPHISEDSLLVYVRKLFLDDGYVASFIKAQLSMTKACIEALDDVDIGSYVNVNSFMRTASKTHKPKKARILTAEQIHNFRNIAQDEEYFLIKVISIIGLIGCCRKSELVYLSMKYLTVSERSILIDIPAEVTKTNTPNTFSIVGPFYVIIKRYLHARRNIDNDRFFLLYRNGTFIDSACGDRTIGSVPKTVAEFLGLPEPERDTSHSIRRSSATVYAESGCTDTELKLHGRWKSTSCASGYLEDTDYRRHKVSALITNAIPPQQANENQTITVQSNHQNFFQKQPKNLCHILYLNKLHALLLL